MIPTWLIYLWFVGLWSAWLAVGFVAIPLLLRGLFRRGAASQRVALFSLFAAALGTRFAFATWGPGDFVIKQWESFGNHPIRVSANFLQGNAPRALWSLLFQVFPATDHTIVVFGILFGSAAAVLVTLALLEMGAGAVASWCAGALLAIDPLMIRFSGTQDRMPQAAMLSAFSLWMLARHRKNQEGSNLVAFAASAWLCSSTRPEAGLIALVAILAIILVDANPLRALREPVLRLELLAAAGAALLGVAGLAIELTYTGGSAGPLSAAGAWKWSLDGSNAPFLSLSCTSIAVMVFGLTGALIGLQRRNRLLIWSVISLILVNHFCALGHISDGAGHVHLANARYRSLVILVFCIVAGQGIEQWIALATARFGARGRSWSFGVAALAIALTSVQPIIAATTPRTIDIEYGFIRSALQRLPPCATIYYPYDQQSHVGPLANPWVLSWVLDRGRWPSWPANGPVADTSCASYYYNGSGCSLQADSVARQGPLAQRQLARCKVGMARSGKQPVVVAEIPARPFAHERFSGDTIRIGFYKLPQ